MAEGMQEEVQQDSEKKDGSNGKKWQYAGPGEVPVIGERVKCPDGEGVVEDSHGHTVQVKLNSEFFWRGGIDQIQVLR